jgi:hypothetical protein
MGNPPIKACPFFLGFVVFSESRINPAHVPHVGFRCLYYHRHRIGVPDEIPQRFQKTLSFGNERHCCGFPARNDECMTFLQVDLGPHFDWNEWRRGQMPQSVKMVYMFEKSSLQS